MRKMRKVFIDAGAHNGNSIEMFLNKYPNSDEFEIYSFECNSILFNSLDSYKDKATIYHKAVFTYDGVIDFYKGNDQSSSIRKDKTSGQLDKKPIKVECIDLAKFIKKFNKEDYIILKLDVEGAEYDILPHLLKEGVFDGYINELFGEWHSHKLTNINDEQHQAIKTKLLKKNFKMKNWNAKGGILN